jgi:hypothetical protein
VSSKKVCFLWQKRKIQRLGRVAVESGGMAMRARSSVLRVGSKIESR